MAATDDATSRNGWSVSVDDRQHARSVDVDRWVALAEGALAAEGVAAPAELSIAFVTSDEIAELNARFLDHEGPTDVLSFPIDGGEPGLGSSAGDPVPLLLGDIVICPEVAAANAAAHAGSYDDEVALLVVHGLLHLLGHDHAEPAETTAMQARERALLDQLHGPLAADPWSA